MPESAAEFTPLVEANCPVEPFDLFDLWFSAAAAGSMRYPNAMNLATVDTNGEPDSRIVLLKSAGPDSFVFFTNYESTKGRELAANPAAALTFYWDDQARQVRVRGSVERVSAEESDEYFTTRPRTAQIGAHVSKQSRKLQDRAALERQVSVVENQFGSGKISRPDYWGGFRLIPKRYEFWQEREFRLHDRIVYQRDGNSWKIERLYP